MVRRGAEDGVANGKMRDSRSAKIHDIPQGVKTASVGEKRQNLVK